MTITRIVGSPRLWWNSGSRNGGRAFERIAPSLGFTNATNERRRNRHGREDKIAPGTGSRHRRANRASGRWPERAARAG
jgi:hypothetical protein